MKQDPSLVIFNSRADAAALPIDGEVILPWSRGAPKSQSFVKRGRPRKVGASLAKHGSNGTGNEDPWKSRDSSSYEFVHSVEGKVHEDGPTRRKIRSHVMKYQQSKQRTQHSSQPINSDSTDTASSTLKQSLIKRLDELGPAIPHEFLSFDPFNCLRVTMRPYMVDIFSKCITIMADAVWPLEVFSGLNPMRDYLLPLALNDVALLHAIMTSSDTIKSFIPECKDLPNAFMHLDQCLRALNERLQSPHPVAGDSTILIVAIMAEVESTIGDHVNGMIHMHGLQHLINLRGGLKTLRSTNRLLYSKLVRSDITGSISGAQVPYFDDEFRLLAPTILQDNHPCGVVPKLAREFQLSGSLGRIVSHVENLTVKLNRLYRRDTSIDALDLRDAINACQYILLHMHLAESNLENAATRRVWCTSVLLYLVSVTYNRRPGLKSCDTIASALRMSIDKLPSGDEDFIPSRLWLAFFVGSMSIDNTNRSWALDNFHAAALQYEDMTMEGIRNELANFLWVEAVHGKTLQWFWQEMLQNQRMQCQQGRLSETRIHSLL